jgi:hypothetical protein
MQKKKLFRLGFCQKNEPRSAFYLTGNPASARISLSRISLRSGKIRAGSPK